MLSILSLSVIAAFLSVAASHEHHKPTWYEERNYKTILSIYNTTIYPHNQAFLTEGASAVPPGLFAANATGRISPIGNFSGFADSTEYFFGLTPIPSPPLYTTWTGATLISFSSSCPEVAMSVVYGAVTGVNPNFTATYGKHVSAVKQFASWRFDSSGAVLKYDASFSALAAFVSASTGISPNTAAGLALIEQICAATTQLCTGANVQFASTAACVTTLLAKPFGSYDEIWADNVVCRSLHVRLARLRPDVHCAHVGPSGGGKCVDVAYNDAYLDDRTLFGKPLGETFVCAGDGEDED